MNRSILIVLALGAILSGCSSTGTLGIVTKGSANPSALLSSDQGYEDLGYVEGRACRHFLLNIFPWGNSDIGEAVNNALVETGGDGMLNVSTVTSLYGFIPIYNVYSFTCTTVKGTAIKIL
jgi:hypothetical protein